MAIIKLEKVNFSYDKQNKTLKNIDLEIEKGEYLAIVGHNGSGKSTLAKIFNGLITPESGKVTVCGIEITGKDNKQNLYLARRKVGVVFQNPDNQLVASIVEDDVAFGAENLGLKREEIGKRIDYALNAVNMQEFRHASPERLSGGQKQRVAIAGVLALKPEILVLDESTSMLDPEGRNEVLEAVKELNQQGVTVVTITHYMDEVIDADRVVVLNDGEIYFTGTPKEVFSNKDRLKGVGLELPLVSYLAEKLMNNGVKISQIPLRKEELLEELCKLKREI